MFKCVTLNEYIINTECKLLPVKATGCSWDTQTVDAAYAVQELDFGHTSRLPVPPSNWGEDKA